MFLKERITQKNIFQPNGYRKDTIRERELVNLKKLYKIGLRMSNHKSKSHKKDRVWCCMPISLVLEKLRQEDLGTGGQFGQLKVYLKRGKREKKVQVA